MIRSPRPHDLHAAPREVPNTQPNELKASSPRLTREGSGGVHDNMRFRQSCKRGFAHEKNLKLRETFRPCFSSHPRLTCHDTDADTTFHEKATEPHRGSLSPCALTRCEDISWRRRNAGHHAWPTRKFRCVPRCRSSQRARLVGSTQKRNAARVGNSTLSHASSPTTFSQACYALNTQARTFSGTTPSSSFLSFQVRLAPPGFVARRHALVASVSSEEI